MSLRIHYLQHVSFEGLGAIAQWVDARGHTASATHLYANEPLPALDDFDWLIVMGGPMGTGDEARYPWLAPEKALIKAAIAADKTVLGICLGSQLIAEVLGGEVRPGREVGTEKEIGWWPIRKTEAGGTDPLLAAMPAEFTVFHWHGDTWSLPPGARLLAESAGCPSQAFVAGRKVVGLQFHFEATVEGVEALLVKGAKELDASQPFIQSAAEIRGGLHHVEAGNRILFALLDQLSEGGLGG